MLGGSHAEKALKELEPIVAQINSHYQSYQSLSHDELRQKSLGFKSTIAERLSGIDQQLEQLKKDIDACPEGDIDARNELFTQQDELEKERDEQLETVLNDILPEAFAVMKDAARRFSENEEIAVSALDLDRELATQKDFVRIENDKAVYRNSWTAAGGQIKWNMVHYDVQLIGGIALHRGKIAEMATGEGKTLVSTVPTYLNALGGRGVHLVTVND